MKLRNLHVAELGIDEEFKESELETSMLDGLTMLVDILEAVDDHE